MSELSNPYGSQLVKALQAVTAEELDKYPGKAVAIGMNGEGIVASADTVEGLQEEVSKKFGGNFKWSLYAGPQVIAKE